MLSTREERRKEADTIINTAAVSAASASAIGGLIPGGSLGVEVLLTGVTVAMVIKLGGLFDCVITETVAQNLLTVVSGMAVGKLALNSILTWIPGVASAAAATISFTFHETAGWIIYESFEKGNVFTNTADINTFTNSEPQFEQQQALSQRIPQDRQIIAEKFPRIAS